MFGQKAVKSYIAVLFAVLMVACATPEEYVATAGSRADGTVSLSYEYSMFQSPREDRDQGVEVAKQACAGWAILARSHSAGRLLSALRLTAMAPALDGRSRRFTSAPVHLVVVKRRHNRNLS
jgi:hypothetical protein